MKIPYGLSDFGRLRREGHAFVDKSGFIPQLEAAELGRSFLVFLRPRRFGKSTLISMLEHYYDLRRADEFQALFGGLEIGRNPTPERNRYLILRIEFTGIVTDRGIDLLRESFNAKIRSAIERFLHLYHDRVPELEHQPEG